MTSASPNIESLLRHQDWVRALARSLVADPSRADDVAQQTMLEAIEKAPPDIRHPKGWLTKVARNAARALARSDRRRTVREQHVARSDVAHADPAEAAQRAAAHKSVVDALFELEEPYHTVVMLRYFEDLDPKQIAEQVGRPVSTVRTQVQRGLAQMREKLDGRFGDRQAWSVALLPLFARPQVASGVSAFAIFGSLAMWKVFVPTAAVAAFLFVSAEAMWGVPEPPAPESGDPIVAAAIADPGEVTPKQDREEVASVSQPESPEPQPVATGQGLRGRVLTTDGAPIANLAIVYHDPRRPRLEGNTLSADSWSMSIDQPGLLEMLQFPAGVELFAQQHGEHEQTRKDIVTLLSGKQLERPRVVTDAFGRFGFDEDYTRSWLRLEEQDRMIYGTGEAHDDDRRVFVVGPGVRVQGRVVDEFGKPIERVYISMGMGIGDLPGFGQQLASSNYESWNENTAKDGSFDMGMVPQHAVLALDVQKRGYENLKIETTAIRSPVKWVMKTKVNPNRRLLTGIVRHADGKPAAKVWLTLGSERGSTGEDGRFEMDVHYVPRKGDLVAYARGVQPTVLEGLAQRVRADASLGRDLELTLGPKALAIAGKVVDAEGEPVAGAKVLLVDGRADGNAYRWIETVVANQRDDCVVTDADGAFELRGLSDRDYRIRAIDHAGMAVIESEPVAAGTVDLLLSAPALANRRLEGVVVDKHGVGVATATVAVMTHLMHKPGRGGTLERMATVACDDQGRFVIERCPLANVHLSVDGVAVDWQKFDVPQQGTARFVVAREHKFKLRVTTATKADRFAVLDAKGERMSSAMHGPGLTSHNRVQRVVRDNGPYYTVTDAATTLVLLQGKQEVGRLPLNLRGLDLNIVDI